LVEFKLRLPKNQNIVWIPKPVADCLGRDLRIMPNSAAAVVYSATTPTREVVHSLTILLQDLQYKMQREEKKTKRVDNEGFVATPRRQASGDAESSRSRTYEQVK
jgi:hypothetical protein